MANGERAHACCARSATIPMNRARPTRYCSTARAKRRPKSVLDPHGLIKT